MEIQLRMKGLGQQLDASFPLKKQLWQQTIKAKIDNSSICIESLCR